jgi:hypothetical protein
MYFDIWQMLLDIFDRLYNLSAHRTSLAQFISGAQTVVQQIQPIYSNFISHAQTFTAATNIKLTDPDLIAKLNNYIDVAVPELLSDPIFSLEPATSYESLHYFDDATTNLSNYREGFNTDVLKEYIRTENYSGAINAIDTLKAAIATIITYDYPHVVAMFELIINTSISSTVTKYTIVQFVSVVGQLVAVFMVAPISLVLWILTKLNLEIVTGIPFNVTLFTIDILFAIIHLLLRRLYGAEIYIDFLTYLYTHQEPGQLESLKLLNITYCDKYVVGVPIK